MNEEQVKSDIRTFLASIGGIIIGWFASKGYELSPETTKSIINLLQSPEFIGIAISIMTGIWGHLTHTHVNAVAVADKIPAVAGVVTKPTVEGRALATAVTSDTVAIAGSAQATKIAAK